MSLLSIKNMVCDRCIFSVNNILNKLDIKFKFISLGEYRVSVLNPTLILKLRSELINVGFDLIYDKQKVISSKIKATLIKILNKDVIENKRISSILLENFNYSYNHLCKVFKFSENISIEKYFLKLKVEKIKEYLSYKELTIKEIAYKLNYNSISHLSNHFKKETGYSPSSFKINNFKREGFNIK